MISASNGISKIMYRVGSAVADPLTTTQEEHSTRRGGALRRLHDPVSIVILDASGETLHLGTTFYASQCGVQLTVRGERPDSNR
jgi:hypothetical protein